MQGEAGDGIAPLHHCVDRKSSFRQGTNRASRADAVALPQQLLDGHLSVERELEGLNIGAVK